MFLIKFGIEDGSFVRPVVEEAVQNVSQGEIPSEPVILPEVKESFGHQLRQTAIAFLNPDLAFLTKWDHLRSVQTDTE